MRKSFANPVISDNQIYLREDLLNERDCYERGK